jgi:hypothetical protein
LLRFYLPGVLSIQALNLRDLVVVDENGQLITDRAYLTDLCVEE